MRKIIGCILCVAFIAVSNPPAAAQMPGPMGGMFQGQTPPPGAITVLGRAFFEAGEAGFGNAFTLMIAAEDQNVRRELGLTDAEVAAIRLANAQTAMNAAQYANRFRTMTEETQQGIQNELLRGMNRITQNFNASLPPERQENVQRFMFQALGGLDSPLMSLHSMEALNLSADQRTRMQQIFTEMRDERWAHSEKMLEMGEKVIAAGGPQNLSQEDRAELERSWRELETQSFETARRLSDRLRQHLTPEQLELERQLIASRPAFLPGLPRQIRERQERAVPVVETEGGFVPGPNSWRPGDPLPRPMQGLPTGTFPRAR